MNYYGILRNKMAPGLLFMGVWGWGGWLLYVMDSYRIKGLNVLVGVEMIDNECRK